MNMVKNKINLMKMVSHQMMSKIMLKTPSFLKIKCNHKIKGKLVSKLKTVL